MLADFTITIDSNPRRAVRVVVHNDIRALRIATTRYNKTWGIDDDVKDTLGVCHRFATGKSVEKSFDSLCAIVRVAPPNIGIGLIAHELAHAAIWINELNCEKDKPLVSDNDEDFCWNLGELIRQTVLKFYEHGLW